MGETSCLSKHDGKLVCHAKDPISSGLALDGFLPARHFERTGAEVFSMGAGGSTIALTWHLMQTRPRRRQAVAHRHFRTAVRPRLEEIRRIHAELDAGVPTEYVLAPQSADNDAALSRPAPGSLVVNATGLGKDAPGSPLTDAARFPERGIVWDLNYRGDLIFLEQARAQQRAAQRCRSRMAGPTSCTAGRRSSRKSSTSTFRPAAQPSRALSEIAIRVARE